MTTKSLLLFFILAISFLDLLGSIEISGQDSLNQEVQKLLYSNQFDSAQQVVISYLSQPDLTEIERFNGYYLYSEVLKAVGRPAAAIVQLQKIKELLPSVVAQPLYASLLQGTLAESYFNIPDYEKARLLATESLLLSPDRSLRTGGHAVNYAIIGYTEYLRKKYESALDYYENALEVYQSFGEECEYPLIYLKMALVHNKIGNNREVEKFISRSFAKSDSCNIDSYKEITYQTLLDIQKEKGEYRKALETLEELSELRSSITYQRQQQSINALATEFDAKLSEQENDNLRAINQKNEEILAKQRMALHTALGAIAILLLFTLLLIRVSRQKDKARSAITLLNAQLEKKVEERTKHLQEATEQLKENSDKLASQNKQFIDFFNIISHNFRAPLANLTMLVKFIERSKEDSEKKLLIDSLKQVSGNLTDTCNELLESMQIMQDTEIQYVANDMNDIMSKILTSLRIEIQETRAEIHVNFIKVPIIFAPKKYLESILHNLVSNALKYRAPQREPDITVTTSRTPTGVRLTVSDNGLGIDLEKHRTEIFKIRKTFHDHPHAKGFGLFLTKTQIESLGGRISVESTPGVGSTFYADFDEQQRVEKEV